MKRLEQLKNAMKPKLCLICFKEFVPQGIDSLISAPCCQECGIQLKPSIKHQNLLGINGESLAIFDDCYRKLINRFKTQLDIALAPVFLWQFVPYLRARYQSYEILLMPSSGMTVQLRGFDHLEEIFKILGNKMLKNLTKNNEIQQKGLNHIERVNNNNSLEIIDQHLLKNRKILLVDDIISTGATMKSAIKLLKNVELKRLRFLSLLFNEK